MVYDFTANNLMATACVRVQDGLFSKENYSGLILRLHKLVQNGAFPLRVGMYRGSNEAGNKIRICREIFFAANPDPFI